jgi:hypothetical protein
MFGSFQAQYFKFLSVDPNTIFQFFVGDDRLYLVKVGSALNQLPQLLRLARGPVGLADIEARGLPTEAEIQKLVRADPANYAIAFSELTACVLKARYWLGSHGALTLRCTERGKLVFRFVDPTQGDRARASLQAALPDRVTIEE